MILELLLSQWKLVLIAALIAACTLQTHRLSNEEKAHVADNIQHQLLTDAAKAKEQESRELSTRTAKEINDAQPKLLEQAKANAVELYKRRYGRIEGSGTTSNSSSSNPLGTGIHVDGLPINSSSNAGAVQADHPKITESASASMDVIGTCDPRFISEAAEAAVVIHLWNSWADSNGFPREK